jgi:hypothetical protein
MANRPLPRFHYAQSRDRYLKRLRKLLGRATKVDALEAFWVLDRGRMDKNFKKPSTYDFPDEFLLAKINEPGAVHGWELETLVTELLACKSDSGPRVLNTKSWAAVSELVNTLRSAGDAESALIDPSLIQRVIFRTLHRQLP